MCTVLPSIIARPLGIERVSGLLPSDRGTGIEPCDATSQKLSPSQRQIADIASFAQPRGIFGNDIQHRLNIRRRAGDDTQDFTRRRLLLQRLP